MCIWRERNREPSYAMHQYKLRTTELKKRDTNGGVLVIIYQAVRWIEASDTSEILSCHKLSLPKFSVILVLPMSKLDWESLNHCWPSAWTSREKPRTGRQNEKWNRWCGFLDIQNWKNLTGLNVRKVNVEMHLIRPQETHGEGGGRKLIIWMMKGDQKRLNLDGGYLNPSNIPAEHCNHQV